MSQMFREVILAMIIAFLSCGVMAQEGLPEGGAEYWDITFPEFQAEDPVAISVPGATGALSYYWYWPFKFVATTNLHKTLVFLEENVDKIDDSREQEFVQKQIERLREQVNAIRMPRAFVAMDTDEGQILYDLSNTAVRNLVERKLGRQLLTVQELSKEPFETGRTYECVAIFPDFGIDVNRFTVRMIGLGNRLRPTYQPGELLYTESVARTSLRKELRYNYRRVGGSGEPYLRPITLEDKSSVWAWMWSTQIFAGRYRLVTVERASGLKREYAYVPYKIWNNTGQERTIDVMKAGLNARIIWRGQPLTITMLDQNESDTWKSSVIDMMKQRQTSAQERMFVTKYEVVQAEQAGEETAKAIEEDIDRKTDIVPETTVRNVNATIAPGKFVGGVMIVEWGVGDIQTVVKTVMDKLREKALVGIGGDSDLYKQYEAIRKVDEKQPVHMRAPEPSQQDVAALLNKLAAEDLKTKGIEITENDTRRYGDLASLGALLNALSAEAILKRADGDPAAERESQKMGGMTDVMFEVKVGDVTDRAKFPALFKRTLPQEWTPPKTPDTTLDPTTGFTTTGGEGEGAKTEKKETKTETEEIPPW